MINIKMNRSQIRYFKFFGLPLPFVKITPGVATLKFINKRLYFDYTITLLTLNHENRNTAGFESNLGLLNHVKFCEEILLEMGKQSRIY